MTRSPTSLAALGAALAVAGLTAAVPAGAHIGCPGKNIHFKASDGTRLVAHRYGAGRTFVVLGHQDGGNLCEWSPYVARLAKLGYSALAFDFRSHGESQAVSSAKAKRVDRDVVAAVKLARSLGAKKVFVVGASLGGWASVVAVPRISPPPAGLVTLSAPPSYLGDSLASAAKLTIPVLYLASKDEGLTEETQALYDATASPQKQMTLVAGNAHGIDLIGTILGKPSWRQVRSLIETFLRTH